MLVRSSIASERWWWRTFFGGRCEKEIARSISRSKDVGEEQSVPLGLFGEGNVEISISPIGWIWGLLCHSGIQVDKDVVSYLGDDGSKDEILPDRWELCVKGTRSLYTVEEKGTRFTQIYTALLNESNSEESSEDETENVPENLEVLKNVEKDKDENIEQAINNFDISEIQMPQDENGSISTNMNEGFSSEDHLPFRREDTRRLRQRTRTIKTATGNIQGINNKCNEAFEQLEKLKIDVCAPTETRKKGNGLGERGNYIHIYSGIKKDKRARCLVALAIKYKKNIRTWEQINERIFNME
ncbi:hypothetical protein ILUMI_00137 [Ignelater luminosus]|uniref:Uncharacterized protein n=1 Tax=Ignelater luminosus TaxID=2038154 RepID=A0A8K0GLJ5_IGNLU|nr:hypothetical protein ILUMI_00137 [Ignelater luminosus]